MTRLVLTILASVAVSGCSKQSGPSRTPENAILFGQPKAAIRMLGLDGVNPPPLRSVPDESRVLFTIATLDLEQWGEAERALPTISDSAATSLLRCGLLGKRGDIDAARRCEEALAGPPSGVLPELVEDSARIGLAAALELNHRVDNAAEILRDLVGRRDNPRNKRALLAFFDNQGWMTEAVAALEAWHAASPDDQTIHARLTAALERKVKGDLLEKRGEEAEKTARRLIEVAPDNGSYLYFLADALVMTKKLDEAEKVKEQAVKSGAPEPVKPDAIPTAPPDHHHH